MSQKYNFNGKVALVTGSSSGIGAAIAMQFAGYGAQVTITGRDAQKLANIADEIEKKTGRVPLQVVGDFLDKSFSQQLFNATIQRFGRLDILVNNAGGSSEYDSLTNDKIMEAYDKVTTLNLRSALEMIHLAAPELEKTKGNIINISSIASSWAVS